MRPFVEQEPAELTYCQACAAWYWTDTLHSCDDPLRAARGILVAVLVGIVFYALIAAAVIAWWGW